MVGRRDIQNAPLKMYAFLNIYVTDHGRMERYLKCTFKNLRLSQSLRDRSRWDGGTTGSMEPIPAWPRTREA